MQAEPNALRIAILGAESTGKTALAQALADRIATLTGLRTRCVDEWLRDWCAQAGRTPHPDEQLAIAQHQHALIDEAAASCDVVVCDTTAVMTAVYSEMLFNDPSIEPFAVAQQRRCHLTLLTALDLPWVADGIQRDGPHVREPVDTRVRSLLQRHALPWSLVAGVGERRVEMALDALTPLLRWRQQPTQGLFTRLAERDARQGAGQAASPWRCVDCDSPECEHATLVRLRAEQAQRSS
jgi:nicotinamide riboside kinase